MDIETFSETYWYIWFLVVLLIIILLLLNGVGVLLYVKRRQKFLAQSNRTNDNIPMHETSTISTIDINKSKYRHISIPSTITNDLPFTNTRDYLSSYTRKSQQIVNSTPNKTKIHEILTSAQSKSSSLDEINEKSDIDLSIEEFQRQALKGHNLMRAMHNKPPFKLNESLNIYAQYWADQCARTNIVTSSRPEWRLHCKGQPLGENIISIKSADPFDGTYFTSLLMDNGKQSKEVECVLNEISTEVGFGRAQNQPDDDTQSVQWIGVAHYYPYRQLTTVQS